MCYIPYVLKANDYKMSLIGSYSLHEVSELYLSWQFHDII